MLHPFPLIGTWLLLSQHTHEPDGSIRRTRGEDPTGILMYDAFGNISVQLMRTAPGLDTYTDMASEEAMIEGYHAYFGTYEVDDVQQRVVHHVIGAAYSGYRGTDQVRYYVLEGDTLTLRTAPASDGSYRVLVWTRAEGPIPAVYQQVRG